MLMHAGSGSNVVLVASPSLLHNVKQTSSKVGNAGGGANKTTHAGDLRMLLETHDRKTLLNKESSAKRLS